MSFYGPFQAMAAICLQALGQVLYTYFLSGIPEPVFVFGSFLLTTLILNLKNGFSMPRRDYDLLIRNNVYTAITYLCFFFALRELDPSVVVAIDTGVALIVGALSDSIKRRAWPTPRRLVICTGVLVACLLLGARQFDGAGHAGLNRLSIWIAMAATAVTGASSALTMSVCAELAERGWSRSRIVSQRFHLTVCATLVWCLALPDSLHIAVDGGTVGIAVVVTLAGVMLPMLLLQSAVQLSGPFAVLVCMSVQPFISLLLATSANLQTFDWRTALGIAIVSLLVVFDVAADRSAPRRKRAIASAPTQLASGTTT
jgi:drug/metabolite transporter (DMT)-like permease